MAGLHPPAALTAAPNLDLEAGHQRPGRRQLLLVLGRHPLQRQLPAAAGAACRQPDRHDLVDRLRIRSAPVGAGAVGGAGLTPRPPGVRPRVALGERRRLALGRPAQRLHLTAQPLVEFLEPFTPGPQPLVHAAEPLAFGLQPLLLLPQGGVLVLKPGQVPAQPARACRTPTGLHPLGHHRHEAEGYNRRLRRQGPAISIPTHQPSSSFCRGREHVCR